MKYKIKEVKVECGGGMACGPVFGPVICEALLEDENGEGCYHILAEVDGIPNFYTTDKSSIEGMLEFDDDTFDNLEYDESCTDYEEIFEADHADIDIMIKRYLMYLVRADWDETERFTKETEGKYLDEIEIPNTDLEEEYLEEIEEEE